ncbi:MAG: hypothetical protein E7442_01810 [Ruminococcaceae bacterium]|nr:hypothetical protein [Oscillospiraceae bacterium]
MRAEDLSRALTDIDERFLAEAEGLERSVLRVRRILLLAAVMACFLSLTALAASIFSAKNGDTLTLGATYGGGGIVYATIENQSDKELTLSPEVKLIYYKDKSEVPGTGRRPYMTELTIPAGETRRVPIDLRSAYDVEALEEPLPNDFYCLQLTNDSFLPGQRWRCILSFRESEYMPRYNHTNQEVFLHTLPTLRSYFQNYTDDVFQRWADVFEYTALVEEALADVEGRIVQSTTPYLLIDGWDWDFWSGSSVFDGYNKLVARNDQEPCRQMCVFFPDENDDGTWSGGWYFPLFFLYYYDVNEIQSGEDMAFMRGCLFSFDELEPYKVYEDEQYVVYEMHHLFYSDIDSYVQEMLLQRPKSAYSPELHRRAVRFYEHWSDKETMGAAFYYHPEEARPREPLTLEKVCSLAGQELSYGDFSTNFGRFQSHEPEGENGILFEIDENWQLHYRANVAWEFQGFFLQHIPSGEEVNIESGDVEAFIADHA